MHSKQKQPKYSSSKLKANSGTVKKMEGFVVMAPPSARALEIAKKREELLGLLHDLPESEHELSLTDLVEKGSPAVASNSVATTNKDTSLHGGDCCNKTMAINERRKKKKKRHSRSSFGGSNDGVLLNLYVPASLTRSLTTPRSPALCSAIITDSNKRDRGVKTFGCWSALWERGREKSRRKELLSMS